MKRLFPLVSGSAVLIALAGGLHGQSAVSDPVGFNTTSCLGNSDTHTSIPFTRPAEFVGAIQSASGSTIAVSSSPGWANDQFVHVTGTQPKTYAALIGPKNSQLSGTITVTNGSANVTGSGTTFTTEVVVGDILNVGGHSFTVNQIVSATSLVIDRSYPDATTGGLSGVIDHSPKEGRFYTVTHNDSNSVTVDLNGDDLASIAAGTQVTLVPYWTLGTAFPATDAGKSFVTSPSTKNRGTQIILPDLTSSGVNLAPTVAYFFFNGAWRQAGSDFTVSHDEDVLPLDSYFIVRHPASVTTPLAFAPAGAVVLNRFSIPLATRTTTAQDNSVAVLRPIAVTLNDLGLISSGAFQPSPSNKNRTDQLLVFDPTVAGINKSATRAYYYLNGGWRLAGADPTVDHGSDTIPAGIGFVVRKAATANGSTVFWQNTRTYLN